MKIELGKTYKTRSGNSTYKVVCVDAPGGYPVIAYNTEDGEACTFTATGSIFNPPSEKSSSDLISEVVPKIVRYANIYSEDANEAYLHKTLREALDSRGDGAPLACIRIEYSPGQFDD